MSSQCNSSCNNSDRPWSNFRVVVIKTRLLQLCVAQSTKPTADKLQHVLNTSDGVVTQTHRLRAMHDIASIGIASTQQLVYYAVFHIQSPKLGCLFVISTDALRFSAKCRRTDFDQQVFGLLCF